MACRAGGASAEAVWQRQLSSRFGVSARTGLLALHLGPGQNDSTLDFEQRFVPATIPGAVEQPVHGYGRGKPDAGGRRTASGRRQGAGPRHDGAVARLPAHGGRHHHSLLAGHPARPQRRRGSLAFKRSTRPGSPPRAASTSTTRIASEMARMVRRRMEPPFPFSTEGNAARFVDAQSSSATGSPACPCAGAVVAPVRRSSPPTIAATTAKTAPTTNARW